jgi:hypothetical protein
MDQIVFPLKLNMKRAAVGDLQGALQQLIDRGELLSGEGTARKTLFAAMKKESKKQTYGKNTSELVGMFQKENHLPVTGTVDNATAEVLNSRLVDLGLLDQPVEATAYQVKGKVASTTSAGVGGLRISVVDKGVGGDTTLVEVNTGPEGAYQATFAEGQVRKRGKSQPDLQARVYAGKTFIGASEVRYNASREETLNVLLDDQAGASMASEHEVLIRTLASQYKGRLADLKETGQRQDITYLANKTGWDARAVALAALADQFSARTANADEVAVIPQPIFYALFRAGLAANDDTLYHTSPKTLTSVLKMAASQGVISPEYTKQIPKIVKSFQEISARKLLTSPALVGASSLNEMMSVSRLNQAQQTRFTQLYAAQRGDMNKFWKSVEKDPAFGATPAARSKTVSRLQLDGKLGALTVNNAPLMQALHNLKEKDSLSDPLQLTQLGFYRPEAWSKLLTKEIPVPKEIPGDTLKTRRENYAEVLSAQIRLSYPTACIAQMVKSKELPLAGAPAALADKVAAFLTGQQGKFELGEQPVEQYLAENKLQEAAETVQQVKRLQRVYQITESDQAMAGLMKRGLDSAYHVLRYEKDTFVKSFAQDVGSADQAGHIFERAAQIHNATLNIVLGFLNARTAPAIGVHSPPSVVDPVPANASDVIAYARLESLFGSMDFCECEHCRSILSPAAYLVDLLLFLQSDPAVWSDYLKAWKLDHTNAPYPFVDQNAFLNFKNTWTSQHPQDPLPNTEVSPFEVLHSRRPDLENLPLTCENTNTALPYIDIVNETLEYYIANSVRPLSLEGFTGNDTAGIASEDLLASPQYVRDSAYTTLRSEYFPMPMPFHQPLESLRRYYAKLEVPLPLAMERLRRTDDLERGVNSYGWRDILMEELSLSRAEHELLTDSPNPIALSRMFGYPNGTTEADVRTGLSNAKQFARRLDISYEDLVSILRTTLINSEGDLVPKLERLGVPFSVLKALKDGTLSGAAFDNLLAALAVPPDPAEYGGNIKNWVKDSTNYSHIMGLITLAIPARPWAGQTAYKVGDCVLPTTASAHATLYYVCTKAGTSAAAQPAWPGLTGKTVNNGTVVWTCRDAASCESFDDMALRYSDPAKISQNLAAVDYVRLLRFIRLWKKLGWTIEQTGVAINALYRDDFASITSTDVDSLNKVDAGFLRLLPRLGIILRVMKTLNLNLKRDLPSLLSVWTAIGTHGDQALYRRMFLNPAVLKQDPVFDDNGYGEFLSDTSPKIVAHAEILRSAFNLTGDEYQRIVTDLNYDGNTVLSMDNVSAIYRRGWLARKLKISVRELLLLVQLTAIDPFALPDPTRPGLVRLIELIQTLKARSLKSAAALYLIWNQDLSGKSAPSAAQVTGLARTLRGDFNAIDDQFAASAAGGEDVARVRMSLVYGQNTSDAFFALLDNTQAVDVAYTHTDSTLKPAILAADPGLSYDDFSHRLAHSGLLTAVQQTALKNVSGVNQDFKDAVDTLFAQSEAARGLFFTRYPELQAAFTLAIAALPANRHAVFLSAFQPELARLRKRQQAAQRLSAAAGVELAYPQILLDPATAPYPLHAALNAARPAMDDMLALQTPGLAARFYFRSTATGTIDLSLPSVASLNYASGGGHPLPNPGNPVSAVWSGQVEAPETGYFNFIIETDLSAAVALDLDGQTQPLTHNGAVWRNTNPIALKAGQLYDLSLKVENLQNALSVEWETPKLARQAISTRYLYPWGILAPFGDLYIRFLKAASLAASLHLTVNELAAFGVSPDYQINADSWLNVLPASGNSTNPDLLLKPFQALLDFARLKAELSPEDESLLAVLKDPAAATQNPDSLLFSLTRWNPTDLNDLLGQFNSNVAGLGQFELFLRVNEACALVQQMGISASVLIRATTNDPAAATAVILQSALRARYDAASWRDVVKPINDELRSLQRDALVAYILHQMKSHPESSAIDTPDKLFEYFLMDVQMDPCMETSRIRHALSSVQLFIERSLMNLEPRVSPAAINADQWAWMKRYRVWEANRKVYLYPENWLEPELRDNKSPFFKEIESELLQSDITEDSATTALLNYLSRLEEVAKLEPCGLFHIPADAAKRTGEITHVVARTPGANRKYYYRRLEYGYWTSWEQIKLEIEDNPVIPLVWNDRLLLFWLRILTQGQDSVQTPSTNNVSLTTLTTSDVKSNPPQVVIKAILCWSEYYNGKWQPAKTSDVNRPTTLGTFNTFSPNVFKRDDLVLGASPENDGLRIHISGCGSSSFLMYNTHSLPVRREDAPDLWAFILDRWRTFTGNYQNLLGFDYDDLWSGVSLKRDVLKPTLPYELIWDSSEDYGWDVPFIMEDSRHVFYVDTQELPVWIRDYYDFGIQQEAPYAVPKPPTLVLQVDPSIPKKPDPGEKIGPNVANPGVIDPAPVERFVSEDAYISKGIGTTATVEFNGTQIGPSGAMMNIQEGS